MADRYSWWKNLTGWSKNNIKDAQQELGNSDKTSAKQTNSENKNNNLISYGMYDSQLEPSFNEHTSRRNLTVSRSGRFKEKRRVRVTMPEHNFYDKNMALAK